MILGAVASESTTIRVDEQRIPDTAIVRSRAKRPVVHLHRAPGIAAEDRQSRVGIGRMADQKVASLRSVQVDDELEPDGCARSRAGKHPIAQITAIGVDADEIPGAGPVDGADNKSETEVCLVRAYEERVETKRIARSIRRQGILRVQ